MQATLSEMYEEKEKALQKEQDAKAAAVEEASKGAPVKPRDATVKVRPPHPAGTGDPQTVPWGHFSGCATSSRTPSAPRPTPFAPSAPDWRA